MISKAGLISRIAWYLGMWDTRCILYWMNLRNAKTYLLMFTTTYDWTDKTRQFLSKHMLISDVFRSYHHNNNYQDDKDHLKYQHLHNLKNSRTFNPYSRKTTNKVWSVFYEKLSKKYCLYDAVQLELLLHLRTRIGSINIGWLLIFTTNFYQHIFCREMKKM